MMSLLLVLAIHGPILASSLDPALGPLIAQYARGTEGAAIVLADALLECRVRLGDSESLPFALRDGEEDDRSVRLQNVAANLLTPRAQMAFGCECTKHAVLRVQPTLSVTSSATLKGALATLEEGISNPAWQGPDPAARQLVFRVWREHGRSSPGLIINASTPRAVWAVWMLMREMPLVALSAMRSIDDVEIEMQIEVVAQMLGA